MQCLYKHRTNVPFSSSHHVVPPSDRAFPVQVRMQFLVLWTHWYSVGCPHYQRRDCGSGKETTRIQTVKRAHSLCNGCCGCIFVWFKTSSMPPRVRTYSPKEKTLPTWSWALRFRYTRFPRICRTASRVPKLQASSFCWIIGVPWISPHSPTVDSLEGSGTNVAVIYKAYSSEEWRESQGRGQTLPIGAWTVSANWKRSLSESGLKRQTGLTCNNGETGSNGFNEHTEFLSLFGFLISSIQHCLITLESFSWEDKKLRSVSEYTNKEERMNAVKKP